MARGSQISLLSGRGGKATDEEDYHSCYLCGSRDALFIHPWTLVIHCCDALACLRRRAKRGSLKKTRKNTETD